MAVPLFGTGVAALLHVSYSGVTNPAATLAEVVSRAVTGCSGCISCIQQASVECLFCLVVTWPSSILLCIL